MNGSGFFDSLLFGPLTCITGLSYVTNEIVLMDGFSKDGDVTEGSRLSILDTFVWLICEF